MNTKEWSRKIKVDRSDWPVGVWDKEPDFYEWTTAVGYDAYASRLRSGVWTGSIIAPHPRTDTREFDQFMIELVFMRKPFTHRIGLVSKTNDPAIGEFCLSMEHYNSPVDYSKTHPYKTLAELIQICEDVAKELCNKYKLLVLR